MITSATSEHRTGTPLDSAELTYVRAPKEITAARYLEMLNILPPVDFDGSAVRQTFKMSELIDDDTATIFCHVNGRYFELQDNRRLTHREILAKCSAV
jgi:hypothetical protein